MFDDDSETYDFNGFGRSPVRADVPVNVATVAEARAHLENFPREHRTRWLAELEAALTAYADIIGFDRQVLQFQNACSISQWIRRRDGTPWLTDAKALFEPELQLEPAFARLLAEISEDAGPTFRDHAGPGFHGMPVQADAGVGTVPAVG
jgi:hypothetical protein